MTAKTATVRPFPKAAEPAAEHAPSLCLCGCEQPTIRARARFLPGHDARLKGRLQRAHRGVPHPSDPSLETLLSGFEAITRRTVEDRTPAGLTAAVNPTWVRFLPAPEPTAREAKPAREGDGPTIRRKVGRWIREGQRAGDTFLFRLRSGELQRVSWDETSDPDQA